MRKIPFPIPVLTGCVSLLLAGNLSAPALAALPPPIRLEAEEGRLTATTKATQASGYSGQGYVTGFTTDDAKVSFTFDGQSALYTVRLRYRTPNGEKNSDISINGAKISAHLPPSNVFTTVDVGRVELKAGKNTLVVEKGWGWYDLDAVELIAAQPFPAPKRVPATLSDAKATPATRALFQRMVSLYGKKTLSGQMDQSEADYVYSITKTYPAILGSDMIEFSATRRSHGAKPEGQTEKLLKTAQQHRSILTLMWHWNAPADLIDKPGKEWWRGFYTDASTFDLAAALSHPTSPGYGRLVADIDVIAGELKKTAAANVPVLWRPLHEAEGKWFWWGAKGPEPFKKLWRLMHDRLTNKHGLHNLIWVYSSGTDPAWYPGDDVVDIVGIDAYPTDSSDPLTGTYESLRKQYDGKKMLALTEFGKVPDIAKMARFGVRWSYFLPWTGKLGPKGISKEELIRLYRAPSILHRLP